MSDLFEKENLIEGWKEYESKYGKVIAHYIQGNLIYSLSPQLPEDVLKELSGLHKQVKVKKKCYGHFEETITYGEKSGRRSDYVYERKIEIEVNSRGLKKGEVKSLLEKIEKILEIRREKDLI
jgi:hypothetical protein